VIVGLGHVDLVCRDLERSLAFYRGVFGPLGLQEPVLFDGDRGRADPLPCASRRRVRARLAEFELYAPDRFRIEVSAARDARL
jgi:catechol 2,3-dioxygenase-like lactoylglutathione lyase family enzyme